MKLKYQCSVRLDEELRDRVFALTHGKRKIASLLRKLIVAGLEKIEGGN